MAFYSYLSTKIIIAFITKSYQDLFGVRSYINAICKREKRRIKTNQKSFPKNKKSGFPFSEKPDS